MINDLDALRKSIEEAAKHEAYSNYGPKMALSDCYEVATEMLVEMVNEKIITNEDAEDIHLNLKFDLSLPDIEDQDR